MKLEKDTDRYVFHKHKQVWCEGYFNDHGYEGYCINHLIIGYNICYNYKIFHI